jgi:hypothetical protein
MAGERRGMCELTARHGRGTAWARHAMYESALTQPGGPRVGHLGCKGSVQYRWLLHGNHGLILVFIYSLSNDHVTQICSVIWEDAGESLIGKDAEESDCDVNNGIILEFVWRNTQKPQKPLIRISGDLAEFWKEHSRIQSHRKCHWGQLAKGKSWMSVTLCWT